MKKKIMLLSLMLLLVFQGFHYAGVNRIAVAAGSEKVDFSSFQIKSGIAASPDIVADLINAANSQLPAPGYEIDLDKQVVLEYTWSLEDGHVFGQDGRNNYSFNLPDVFKLIGNESGQLMGDKGSYGTFVATPDGTVTITFDKAQVAENDPAWGDEVERGTLYFWVYFDETKVNSDNEIEIPIPGGNPIKVKVKADVPVPKTYGIQKSGTALPTSFNPTSIKWTIDANTTGETITHAKILEKLPEGVAAPTQSDVKVMHQGIEIPNAVTVQVNGSDLEFLFNQTVIDSTYSIEFETAITDNTYSDYTNRVFLQGDELVGLEIKDEANVRPTRGTPLAKSGQYNSNKNVITWTIKYNFNHQLLTAPELSDVFDSRLAFVKDSLEVKEITTASSNNPPASEGSPSSDWIIDGNEDDIIDTFKLIYNGTSNPTSKAYIFTYETKIKDTTYIYDNTSFENEISYGTATPVKASQDVGQRFFHKDRVGFSYATRTIDWNVKINEWKYSIKGVSYEDTFSPGQRLKNNSLQIEKDGAPQNLDDYSITYTTQDSETVTGFNITLSSGASLADTGFYEIKYSTVYDYDTESYDTLHSSYNNSGVLNWTGADNATASRTDNNNHQSVNPETINNGYKQGAYNASTKKITWESLVNYNSKKMVNATFVDEIQSIQKLDESTIIIHETSISANGNRGALDRELTRGTDYSVDVTNNVLTINFLKEMDKPHYITFVTDVEDKLISDSERNIPNKAVFSAPGQFDPKELTASVEIKNAGKFLSKTGSYDSNKEEINWEILINLSQSKLNNVSLLDTPSVNQIVLKDSFELYETNVAANENVTLGAKVTDWNAIGAEVIFNDNVVPSTFELKFNEISRPYILKYASLVDADSTVSSITVTNEVDFTGTLDNGDQLSGNHKTDESISINLQGSGGGASKRTGDLKLIKLDTETNSPLEGAEFEIFRPNGTVPVRSGLITNAQGIVEAAGLTYGKYELREVNAPAGYKPLGASLPFTIDAATVEQTILNERETGDLEITKVNRANHSTLLGGAEFTLYNADKSVVIGTVTTGADKDDAATFGLASLNDLPFGTYILKETKAPAGYYITGTGEQTIEIKPNETFRITVENNMYSGGGGPIIFPTPTPVETEEPVESPNPTETPVSTVPTPTPTPTPTPGVPTTAPTPTPTPSNTPAPTPVTEKTDEETPVGGEIEVPTGGTTEIGTPPSNGTITITPDGKWTYKPNPGFVGKDKFSIIIADEDGNEEEIWFDIDVDPIPQGGTELSPDGVNTLPKTGQDSYSLFYLLGAILIGGGLALRLTRNRKTLN